MGIKNLMKYIKQNHSEAIINKDISELEHKIVCIDTPCLMYKYKFSNFSEGKTNWVNNLIFFLLKSIEYNIDCVFVLEGNAPEQKNETKAERVKAREGVVKRSSYLTKLFTDFLDTGVVSEELSVEWNKLKHSGSFNPEIYEKMLKNRQIYSEHVTKEDYSLFLEVIDAFNICSVQSNNEAETTCSYILSQKKCDYIYSHDTDVLAYKGVNGFISDINLKDKNFTFVDKVILLQQLKFTEDEFIDFCILCGTDYNKTINKVGIVSSLKLITKQRTIENLSISPEDIQKLNISWIREKFSMKEFEDNKNDELSFKIPWPKCNRIIMDDIISNYNITIFHYIKSMLESFYQTSKEEEEEDYLDIE